MEQLLWIESLIKGGAGLLLLIMPSGLSRALGLVRPEDGFWARVAGALLTGLGVAAFLTGSGAISPGLSLQALAAVNLIGAAALIGLQAAGLTAKTRRGRAMISLCTLLFVVLGIAEVLNPAG